MLPHKKQGTVFIVLTFIIALYLTILPMPDWAQAYRPPWITLVLIYWCIAVPDRIGVIIGWGLGLAVDALTGATLGENALALAFVAYICLQIYNRLRVFPLWQQALFVFGILMIQYLLSYWIRASLGQSPDDWLFWLPVIIGAFIWPWLFVIMRDFRRRFKVA